MELKWLFLVMILFNYIYYFIEKDDIKKNRYLLWVIFYLVSMVGSRILDVLEEING